MTKNRKVVSFTVHKNNRDRIEDRRVSRELLSDAKIMTRRKDVHGYALVTWTRDQDADVAWRYSENVPTSVMPEFVKGAIQRKISMIDCRDD